MGVLRVFEGSLFEIQIGDKTMSKKLVVFFQGIGYHNDKPLLYYSRKLAAEAGFQCVRVDYNGFASGIKGNADKMREAL